MKKQIIFLLIAIAISLSSAGMVHARMYMYLSNDELTRFGDRSRFWSGDTIEGPIHSNSEFAISGCPVFWDTISTTGDLPDLDPNCNHGTIIRHAARVEMSNLADRLRPIALAQGHFYNLANKAYYARFSPGQVHMAMWERGMFPDTVSQTWTLELSSSTSIFVDGPLDVCGIVRGEVTIGASGTIRIVDDIRYEDANRYGRWLDPNANHVNYLGLVSELDIKIANTPANGRWNSAGGGTTQPNLDSTSVCITAALVALGESFTFEQQNDADSGYICTAPCNCGPNGQGGGPDNRGYIYLLGSVAEMRRGYVHRSTCTSTGYLKSYHYDQRFRHHPPPGIFFGSDTVLFTQSIDFGDVTVGQTAWDTVQVRSDHDMTLGSVYASFPFNAVRVAPYEGTAFHIPVRFTPPRAGLFSGYITIGISSEIHQIPVRGRGVQASAPPLALDVSPNPFNLTTTLRYSLPEGQAGKLSMFDLLGRTVKEFDLRGESAGQGHLSFNASEIATGVYFIRLQAGKDAVTKKVLLLK